VINEILKGESTPATGQQLKEASLWLARVRRHGMDPVHGWFWLEHPFHWLLRYGSSAKMQLLGWDLAEDSSEPVNIAEGPTKIAAGSEISHWSIDQSFR